MDRRGGGRVSAENCRIRTNTRPVKAPADGTLAKAGRGRKSGKGQGAGTGKLGSRGAAGKQKPRKAGSFRKAKGRRSIYGKREKRGNRAKEKLPQMVVRDGSSGCLPCGGIICSRTFHRLGCGTGKSREGRGEAGFCGPGSRRAFRQ